MKEIGPGIKKFAVITQWTVVAFEFGIAMSIALTPRHPAWLVVWTQICFIGTLWGGIVVTYMSPWGGWLKNARCSYRGHDWDKRMSGWRCERCLTFRATNPFR